ncbi:hypothetical protein L211DRAFT_371641 [Terfezia boudieri ATCC MYA-4762]|uniref:DUF8035 domain-containing protein n=1 Tax=Terfezia boudieri ATCC MYA-4762 TaxID=1051890 RepID=A0A3N4M2V2_9PEZI|nr:hypothetical protein L211DRAFT_371641 [Terfezia boudieri ATCC MYA-4762]
MAYPGYPGHGYAIPSPPAPPVNVAPNMADFVYEIEVKPGLTESPSRGGAGGGGAKSPFVVYGGDERGKEYYDDRSRLAVGRLPSTKEHRRAASVHVGDSRDRRDRSRPRSTYYHSGGGGRYEDEYRDSRDKVYYGRNDYYAESTYSESSQGSRENSRERYSRPHRASSSHSDREIDARAAAEKKAKEAAAAEQARIQDQARKLLEAQEAAKKAAEEKDKEEKAKVEKLVEERIAAENQKNQAVMLDLRKPTHTKFSKTHLCKEALDERKISYTEHDSFLVHRWVDRDEQNQLWARTKQIRAYQLEYQKRFKEEADKAPVIDTRDGPVKIVRVGNNPPVTVPVVLVTKKAPVVDDVKFRHIFGMR